MLRPLAVTGELTYTFPDKSLKTTNVTEPDTGLTSLQFNNGASRSRSGGLSLQYSIPYLQSQVKNMGLTGIFSDLIPIVEFTWSSATSAPSQQPTMWTAAPGVIYLANWGEIGVEALFPLNKVTGTHIGASACSISSSTIFSRTRSASRSSSHAMKEDPLCTMSGSSRSRQGLPWARQLPPHTLSLRRRRPQLAAPSPNHQLRL